MRTGGNAKKLLVTSRVARAVATILTSILTNPPFVYNYYARATALHVRYTFAASRSNGESFDLNMMTLCRSHLRWM